MDGFESEADGCACEEVATLLLYIRPVLEADFAFLGESFVSMLD